MQDWVHLEVAKYLTNAFSETMAIAERHGLPKDYSAGERPRHFAGALDRPKAVKLVLLLAEPGSYPYEWEKNRDPSDWLFDVTSDGLGLRGGHKFVYDPDHAHGQDYKPRHALFPARFIHDVWPDSTVSERMHRTIVANSFWMQATKTSGLILSRAVIDFSPILAGFIDLFPEAVVVTASRKAIDRIGKAGKPCIAMDALTLPRYNASAAKQSHAAAARKVRSLLQ